MAEEGFCRLYGRVLGLMASGDGSFTEFVEDCDGFVRCISAAQACTLAARRIEFASAWGGPGLYRFWLERGDEASPDPCMYDDRMVMAALIVPSEGD